MYGQVLDNGLPATLEGVLTRAAFRSQRPTPGLGSLP